ncbi:MAG: hypothetical protein JOZ55_07960, partial [Alphaproteobacteria bacterium]|nr:hypothetical protein [Alphaproteobacteria bacterium]
MTSLTELAPGVRAVQLHLGALAPLSASEREALEAACACPVSFRAGKEVVAAGASLDGPWFVLEG